MAVEKLTKKPLLYFSIVILVGLISLFLIWHFSKMPEIKEIPLPIKPISKEEETIKKQLQELESLITETSTIPEKEIQTQIKELENLQKEQKPQSEEEIRKQLEELEKLRQ